MSIPTSAEPSLPRPYAQLFLVSFLLLFFELACIRWFGATVVFLTFFTNIVLFATFLGMSVGCLAAASRRNWSRAVVPLFLLTVVLAFGTLWAYGYYGELMVDVGGQGSPQQVYFGTEYRARDIAGFVIPIELLAGTFFVLIALVFAGIGQIMGRAFSAAPDHLLAYTSNLAGSVAGIVAFAAASYWQTTPLAWFTVAGLIWLYLLKRPTAVQVAGLIATVVLIGALDRSATIIWSPYYKIRYTRDARAIETNNIGHQQMVDADGRAAGYQLPHLLNRDAGGRPFENVLIIGAGSGNDVTAALAYGAKNVDAVEIDPAIYNLGRAEHPNHPYQDPRVTVHIDDGRSFLRNTTRRYDLIVYALVDSLVLHSGYSSLRLESFLFTEQSFAEIADRLAPDGVFAAYNFYRQGWIVGRIQQMAEDAFRSKPLVMSLPHVERIGPNDSQAGRITFILAGRNRTVTSIRDRFTAAQSFWVNDTPQFNHGIDGFSPQPPPTRVASEWRRIAPAAVDTTGITLLPTDDWPFLYLREARVPALNVRSVVLLGVLSLGILYALSPVRGVRPNWRMFFLGAGFMLLETKSVVHMSLLFGSTWLVNSIVFFAILIMVLASNLFVLAVRPRKLWPYYVLLGGGLVLNILVPMSRYLSLPGSEKVVISCAVTFLPIFFAGILFGTLFRDSTQPDVDFGSNIAGTILGGLAESLSLVVGFNYLMMVALVFYGLSIEPFRMRR